MTRAAAPAPAPAPPLKAGHFLHQGRECVSVNLSTHKAFARACCDELLATEGRSLHRFLGFAKAISVPVTVLDGARARLGRKEGEEADGR